MLNFERNLYFHVIFNYIKWFSILLVITEIKWKKNVEFEKKYIFYFIFFSLYPDQNFSKYPGRPSRF